MATRGHGAARTGWVLHPLWQRFTLFRLLSTTAVANSAAGRSSTLWRLRRVGQTVQEATDAKPAAPGITMAFQRVRSC